MRSLILLNLVDVKVIQLRKKIVVVVYSSLNNIY